MPTGQEELNTLRVIVERRLNEAHDHHNGCKGGGKDLADGMSYWSGQVDALENTLDAIAGLLATYGPVTNLFGDPVCRQCGDEMHPSMDVNGFCSLSCEDAYEDELGV